MGKCSQYAVVGTEAGESIFKGSGSWVVNVFVHIKCAETKQFHMAQVGLQ
jgi:hypothetical protein